MNDFGCGSSEDGVDLRTVANQLVRELHRLDGRDAARDAQDNRLALELHALPSTETFRGMHSLNDFSCAIYSYGLRSNEGGERLVSGEPLIRPFR